MMAILGTDDVYLDAAPVNSTITHNFDLDNIHLPIDSNITTNDFCQNIKNFQSEVDHETKRVDNLLKTLRQYYKEIKTNGSLV
jgi:hypothetical protein